VYQKYDGTSEILESTNLSMQSKADYGVIWRWSSGKISRDQIARHVDSNYLVFVSQEKQ
jgi:hypothetical protein